MKRATQLTIFSTVLIFATVFVLYFLLLSELDAEMRPMHLLIFALAALLAYVVSAIIIDQTLNPIRLMISKVNEVGKMDFSKPLVIDGTDDELREYVAAFNSMSQKLHRYIERQKQFVSDASHELSTPITVINGHADMLLRHKKEHPELLDDGLEVIKSEIQRMDGLVDSLLLLARSDSGKQTYNFETVDLSGLLLESIGEAKLVAPDFSIEPDLEPGIKVRCDEYAIRRVMRGVLSNAVKYSDEGRLIQVKASVSHGMARISVKDSGIGIAPEHLPIIFDRFFRVDPSRSKKTGSSGLGLAIAKEIIEAHGGEINVESTVGEGSEFSITLSA